MSGIWNVRRDGGVDFQAFSKVRVASFHTVSSWPQYPLKIILSSALSASDANLTKDHKSKWHVFGISRVVLKHSPSPRIHMCPYLASPAEQRIIAAPSGQHVAWTFSAMAFLTITYRDFKESTTTYKLWQLVQVEKVRCRWTVSCVPTDSLML